MLTDFRHISRSGYIHVPTVECNLATRCLRYLTFECFRNDCTTEELQEAIREGTLAFQDYAAAKWFDHVRAVINITPNVFTTNTDCRDALEEMGVSLEDFANLFEEDVLKDSVLDEAEHDCQSFRSFDFHISLLYVCNHIHYHLKKGSESRNDISLQSLKEAFFRNRQLLEELSPRNATSTSESTETLTMFYGKQVFKCPKTTCFYFHEGFSDAKSRDQHINRHDRPYLCAFPDCSIAVFGFASQRSREA